MSAQSIDVLDTIEIEVEIKEGKEASNSDWNQTPEQDEADEIISITYEGKNVTNLLSMFTDEELIENDTLETELSLTIIKELAQ